MRRQIIKEREDWKSQAESLGFNFHSMYGAAYWFEAACYQFTLRQIEDDIEDPCNELEQMCFEIVEQAIKKEEMLIKLSIPESFWDYIRNSWIKKEKNLSKPLAVKLSPDIDDNEISKIIELIIKYKIEKLFNLY